MLHIFILFVGGISFDNHIEMLHYLYNSTKASGKLNEIIDKVKSQPKMKPSDYNYNTQEARR